MPEVRVISEDGQQLGLMAPEDAIAHAEEVGLDVVEVAPNAKPPVCRIMDYGKYKYEQKKKAGKGRGHAASLKEVKLRPRTDDHDLAFKLRNARRFLIDGDKEVESGTVTPRRRHESQKSRDAARVDDLVAELSIENQHRRAAGVS